MVTKTITITKEAYGALARDKRNKESFSEVILRTHKRKGTVEDIMKFAGAWSDMSNVEAERLHKHIRDVRKGAGKFRRKELMKHFK
jgi:predicted CopG family antitoxin